MRVEELCYTITVQDFGKGIPQEILSKVYTPFFTTGNWKGGTGLGLTIAYNLATTALKGSMDIQSRPGIGTSVTITFPQEVPESITTGQAGGLIM